ncbi:MAG TPA: S8 family serine peptidase [Pyrinomonadaceae bacterium]|nr:S8 family serine peptidase [Pyrinomonadaceae bacterium]
MRTFISQFSSHPHLRVAVTLTAFLFISLASWAVPNISRAALPDNSKSSTKSLRRTFVPGEILVRFNQAATPATATSKSGMKTAMLVQDDDGQQLEVIIEKLNPGAEIVSGLRMARVAPDQTLQAIEALRKRSDVIYAEPNFIRRKASTPNDPRYSEMWGLNNTGQPASEFGNPGRAGFDVHAETAWNTSTGSRSVVVGVVDEGIDVSHEDLRDNIWTNPGEVAGNGLDDDANGFIDDINGWDFAHNDSSVFDYTAPNYPPAENYSGDVDDHGTHVAGTIGATGNNGIGVVGVNWQVSLMSLKFLRGDAGEGKSSDLLNALSYAKAMRELWTTSGGTKGANLRVLNNSYGGDGFSQAELEAIRALGEAGILFVVAAGNEGLNNDRFPVYPSSYISTNLISVAASGGSGTKAHFSNFGEGTVHLTAPGEYILSTTPRNTYNFADGTSMAAPHVAGAAALVCAASPNISVQRLRSLLLYSRYTAPLGYSYEFNVATRRSVDAGSVLQNVTNNDAIAPGSVTGISPYSPGFPNYGFTFTNTGDDGGSGQASTHEIRCSDSDLRDPAVFDLATPLAAPIFNSSSTHHAMGRLPWRHTSLYVGLRAVDEVGNAGPITLLPNSITTGIGDPYIVTESAAVPLSTGGTRLGLKADDEKKTVVLPFSFRFYEGDGDIVEVSSNGAIYIGLPPSNDSQSSTRMLNGFKMIAGLWDDLRTDRRPDDDVYLVQPHENRIIFRWEAVTFDTPLAPGVSRGEHPVKFEIELQNNGTVIMRYGDGNQQTIPVVGLGGGWPEPYEISSHTSTEALKDLTNAGTITFTHRNPPPPPSANLNVIMTSGPNPVAAGSTQTYNFLVLNGGPFDAPNSVLSDPLPSGVTLVSCTTTKGSCSGAAPGTNGTVTVNLGTLDRNGMANITIVTRVTAPPGSTISNTATVSSNRFDQDSSNNSVTATAQVVLAAPFGNVVAISSAYFINFALRQDGTVWGWGRNDATSMGNGVVGGQFTNPVPVNSVSAATAISTGGTHTLALKSDGTVWSWGFNTRGETGGGPMHVDPLIIDGLNNVTAVSAGANHSMAMKNDGTVWIWGGNDRGQLGLGSEDSVHHAVPVAVPGLTGVTDIAAGTWFSVVVRNDGTVWTWGENQNGQLGVTGGSRNTPVQVSGISGVKSVAVSYNHVLALKTDGTVFGWGMNEFGQTGSTSFGTLNATPAQVNNLTNVTRVAAGRGFSLALKTDGTVWAWGLNGSGQLGKGPTGSEPQPNPSVVSDLSSVSSIAAGDSHGLALLRDGTLQTWGDNTYAQLGDGTNFTRSTPREVTGVLVVSQPHVSPESSARYAPLDVRLTTDTLGAVIHYTINGQEPTENDPFVESGRNVVVTQSVTLKARAYKSGWFPSTVTTATYQIIPPPTPREVNFSALDYGFGEGSGRATVTVNRTGDLYSVVTIRYVTTDGAELRECNAADGLASSRCDYATTVGTLRFEAGESSKTIYIPIVNDAYAEGNETFSIFLDNPTGIISVGQRGSAQITIQDDETTNTANPIDDTDFFIRQQYIDFLGREPDPGGLSGWRNVLNKCGTTIAQPCDRTEVSAGFFRSEEFQSRGYFIYRFFSVLGRIPLSEEFYPDFAKVSGFLTNAELEANKAAYVHEVMSRTDFRAKYGSSETNPTAFVEALLQTVGLPAHPAKQTWVNTLTWNNTMQTRGEVLRQLVESPEVFNKYYNEAFVIMQYFGYLRRTADASYLNWIQTMNSNGGDYRIMINGFMNSSEYRRRFGQ